MIEGYVPVKGTVKFWGLASTEEETVWDRVTHYSYPSVDAAKSDGWRVVKVREVEE